MPKRTPADPDKIIEAYKRLGSKKEAAKELGISWQTVAKHINLSKGICPYCWNPIEDSKNKSCDSCRKRITEARQEDRERRLDSGLCFVCNKPRHPSSNRHCLKHKRQASKRGKEWKDRHPDLVVKYLHRRAHRSPDGKVNRLVIYERDNFKCVICGASERLEAHHVDQNHYNNTLENLDTICFWCHRAITFVLKVSNKKSLLDYLQTKYP